MKFVEANQILLELKKRHGRMISNIIPGICQNEQEIEVYRNEKGIVFIVQEPNRKRGFFSVTDKFVFKELADQIPMGVIMEYLYRNENNLAEFFAEAGMAEYTKYIRLTINYLSNPYLIPEKGRRKVLMDMYDPDCGDFALLEDVDELYRITKETFDVNCDDVFTIDRWKEIVQNDECLVVRENGEIITYYVWRQEGKKLYSNMSVNRGPANLLYNIERRIFEDMWEKGIRVYYAWYNEKNIRALKRRNVDALKAERSREYMYNAIYIK